MFDIHLSDAQIGTDYLGTDREEEHSMKPEFGIYNQNSSKLIGINDSDKKSLN